MSKSIQLKNNKNEKMYPHPYYPIGSIYLSVNDTNPSKWFGGTWEQIKDLFLLACGEKYKNGDIGGNASHSHLTAIGSQNNGNIDIDFSMATDGVVSNNAWGGSIGLAVGAGKTLKKSYTTSSSNMPPYLAVYVWKRIA